MTRRPGSVHERSCYCLVSHVANRTASPVTTNPQRTPELDLIYERRRRLGLSLATAGKIAGISDSYWKAIEDGTREIRGPKGLLPGHVRDGRNRVSRRVGAVLDPLAQNVGQLQVRRHVRAPVDLHGDQVSGLGMPGLLAVIPSMPGRLDIPWSHDRADEG